MSSIPMQPTWPEVRCDTCRLVYTLPLEHRIGMIVGACPSCGGQTFSTVFKTDAGVTWVSTDE